tara:strand:- start:893 stop:1939 length:1047 start_codon:yes stop_codon:yes gene_type:complete
MSNWKDRDMCEPYLNENEDENPFSSGGSFWEVTFRTSWTDEQGEDPVDSFEARRELAGINAVGFLLDYFHKESGPHALAYFSGNTQYAGATMSNVPNCQEYHEVFNPPNYELAEGTPISLPEDSPGAYYIPGQGSNDSAVGHLLESGPEGKLLFHVKINKSWIDSFAMVEEQLQDMQGEAPFAIVLKLQNLKDDINELVDTVFEYYKGRMDDSEKDDGFEFNVDLQSLGKEMKKFPKTIGDYLRKASPDVCDWDDFEIGIDTNYDDRMEIGFNGDLTIAYVAMAGDPKREQGSASAEPGETSEEPKKWIAVPSRVGIKCLNMTVPFDNARLINMLMRMYSMTDEQPGT